MEKILISSCLLGNKVRYDGKGKSIPHPVIATWLRQDRLVIICPEMAGGLPTPRPRAEQFGKQVFDEFGLEVSVEFIEGAKKALALCQKHAIKYAILKEFSPSCGSTQIYNGKFNGQKIAGKGVTAKLLSEHGIKVYSELSVELLMQHLDENLK